MARSGIREMTFTRVFSGGGWVGAPDWHGRNFDALRDNIAAGSINAVEVPYRLVIKNYDKIAPSAMPDG